MSTSIIPDETWDKLKKVIDENGTFTITTHVNADGDAIGSELAVYNYLAERGKKVRILNNDPMPSAFHFLVESTDLFEEFEDGDAGQRDWILNSDVIFIMDISNSDRLSRMKPVITESKSFKVCIDHHEGNNFFADLNIISVTACATAEIVYDAFIYLGGTIDRQTATALYIAILTDTGSFSHSNTVDRAHLIAADLIKLGIEPDEIYRNVYENGTWERMELFTMTLSSLKKECNGKIAWMKITEEMVAKSGAKREELEGFVDFPMSVSMVELSILFLEVRGKGTKISLRSKNNIDVYAFAHRFRGGGHKHAAGIRLVDFEIDESIDLILEEAKKLL